MDHFNH